MINTIGFPGLGLEFSMNRVAFSLFGHPVYWYGILIVIGMLAGVLIVKQNMKRIGMDQELLFDFLLWAIPASIIGARIYYVATSWSEYRDHPLSALYIWEGGIAVYGALIAAIITLVIFCRCKKLKTFDFLDCCCIGMILGQAIGRWGNFVNAEAHGVETALPWRMALEEGGKTIAVHPTFLYESLWNLIGFFLLLYLFRNRRKFSGQIFWSYLIWYGVGRFFIEGLRTDSLYIGSLRISQCVAVLSVAAGIAALIVSCYQRKRGKQNE